MDCLLQTGSLSDSVYLLSPLHRSVRTTTLSLLHRTYASGRSLLLGFSMSDRRKGMLPSNYEAQRLINVHLNLWGIEDILNIVCKAE